MIVSVYIKYTTKVTVSQAKMQNVASKEFVKFLIFLAVSGMCRIIIAVRNRIITMRQKCLVNIEHLAFSP